MARPRPSLILVCDNITNVQYDIYNRVYICAVYHVQSHPIMRMCCQVGPESNASRTMHLCASI